MNRYVELTLSVEYSIIPLTVNVNPAILETHYINVCWHQLEPIHPTHHAELIHAAKNLVVLIMDHTLLYAILVVYLIPNTIFVVDQNV